MLIVKGDSLKKAIAALRASNAAADSVFRILERSDMIFAMIEMNDVDCPRCDRTISGVALDHSNRSNSNRIDIGELQSPAFLDHHKLYNWSGAATVNIGHRDGAGNVAWHEAAHLTGMAIRGKLYQHCTEGLRGVPNACPKGAGEKR